MNVIDSMADWFWGLNYTGTPSLILMFGVAPLLLWLLLSRFREEWRMRISRIALQVSLVMIGFVLYTGAEVGAVVSRLPIDHPARITLQQAQARHDYAAVRTWEHEWLNKASA
jgi:hypothetical protein